MDRIEQIINEWDPIGLFPMAPKDEYVEEGKKIVEYIEKWPNITEKKLADRINKIFIEAFEARMESVFVHDRLKRKVTYRTALKLDCYKLIKYILEGQEFIPFSLKDNR